MLKKFLLLLILSILFINKNNSQCLTTYQKLKPEKLLSHVSTFADAIDIQNEIAAHK